MKIPNSKLYQANNNRLIASMRKKGILINYYPGSATADVCFLDNPQTVIKGIQVSDSAQQFLFINLPAGGTVNRRCVVDIFDESNSTQMIIPYTY